MTEGPPVSGTSASKSINAFVILAVCMSAAALSTNPSRISCFRRLKRDDCSVMSSDKRDESWAEAFKNNGIASSKLPEIIRDLIPALS